MNISSLQLLADEGLNAIDGDLHDLVEWCWDWGVATGDARYSVMWRVLREVDEWWDRDWLDPGGHTEGMLHLRAVWSREAPAASAELVPLAELRGRLPGDHPVVSPAERAEALRQRRRAAQRRFSR